MDSFVSKFKLKCKLLVIYAFYWISVVTESQSVKTELLLLLKLYFTSIAIKL